AMIVLEKALKKLHPEIDIVTTPVGDSVAMVHANNCTSDINAWVKMFQEFSGLCGKPISTAYIYPLLFNTALSGDKDCGGVLSYGYYSGESITNINEGRPVLVRTPDSNFNVSNLMRSHILSAFSTLAIGMEILVDEENIQIDKILGHGGIFKTPKVGQSLLAAAINSPVSVMETAALDRFMKVMSHNQSTGFMEDYTYELAAGKEAALESHMLEVDPTLAHNKPKISVNPLGIGGKEDPARLIFDGKAGSGVVVSMADFGTNFKLLINEVEAFEPTEAAPNLPVARVLWEVKPNFHEGVKSWIEAGGGHHTVVSLNATSDQVVAWAKMVGVDYVVIK
ncbi:FGGY-family carbohydrate kinase, partial [Streptococcus equinus]|uniref:FGGY-family carbohydrate kinase n=1 Tax=Streptococcus equinus TaxID=1335 RepID=UPI0022A7ADFE